MTLLWNAPKQSSVVRGAYERVESLVAKLSLNYQVLQRAARGIPRPGEWLWNPAVGCARIERIDAPTTVTVHIRSKAATLPLRLLAWLLQFPRSLPAPGRRRFGRLGPLRERRRGSVKRSPSSGRIPR